MKLPLQSGRRSVAALLALAAVSQALRGEDDLGPVRQPKSGDFIFSLLPKSFQRTPDLEMTVNTELTPSGRLLRAPSPAEPVYYVAHSSGFKPMGDVVAGERSPTPEAIERALNKSLGVNGYLPSTKPTDRPTLLILYFWGSHNRMDRETERQFPRLAAQHRLQRAMLVGGHHQVEVMSRVLEWGESLTDRTPEYEYLRDQSLDDLYYVVASAYDLNALAHQDRKLLWRTTMTVNAKGVSMEETISPLIATAGPYFGRETAEPAIAQRRIGRWGVNVGESKVIEGDVPLPTPPTAPKPIRTK